ncbi:MAG: hypothetical protein WBN34_00210 [Woeseia sp.]
MEWAKENMPLLAMRGDEEVRRIVRLAVEKSRALQFGLATIGAVLGSFAVGWLRRSYIDEAIEKGELYIVVGAIGGFLAWLSWYLAELYFRHSVRKIANAA